MAFPTTSVLVDFNFTENPLAHGFTTPLLSGDYQTRANGTEGVSASTGWSSAYYATTVDASCEVFGKIGTSGSQINLYWRIQSPGTTGIDGYSAEFLTSNTCNVYRIDNNVYTLLSTFTISGTNNGSQMGITMIGSTIRFYKDGVEQGSPVTDGTYGSNGYIGFRQYSTGPIDDFGGGAIVSAGAARIDIAIGL